LNTRLIAARVLTRVIQDGQSLTAALDANLPALELSKDKAFVQALCYGVCRHYYRLDFILTELITKPIKDLEIKALALVGIYQLSYMRVKPYAAVSETVLATRKKPWAKGLINALLRNFQREQEHLEQKANANNWIATSHPRWLVQKIEQDWPEHAQNILFENNQQPPMSLRVNLSRLSTEQYLQQLSTQAIKAVAVDDCPSAIILEKPVAVELLPGFMDGLVSVQDVAAQLAANLLDVQPGQRVLDVCAAPGGKAAHILEHQPQLKELVAVDIDSTRLLRVNDTLQRLKLTATLIVGDAQAPHDWWDGQLFERVLLDAPCSALGVIRRHPDIKLLRRADDIEALQALQQNILHAIWPLLAPGGLLVYATCSILKQENEQQIAAFLATHADAKEVIIEDVDWGIATIHGRQIITGTSAMDGFYYARLVKIV
jgi:16S rRNA (cytosine967-C5)-methyltransferase